MSRLTILLVFIACSITTLASSQDSILDQVLSEATDQPGTVEPSADAVANGVPSEQAADLLEAVLATPIPHENDKMEPSKEEQESAHFADDDDSSEKDEATASDMPYGGIGDDLRLADLKALHQNSFQEETSELESAYRKKRIMLSGGGGGDGFFINGDIEMPMGKYFDLQFRGTYVTGECEVEKTSHYTTYRYYYSWWSGWHSYPVTRTHTYYEKEDFSLAGAFVLLDWTPWRDRFFAPYVGFGACFQTCELGEYEDEHSGQVTVAARIGVVVNFSHRLSLRGELAASGYTLLTEFAVGMGLRLSHATQLHLIVRNEGLSLCDDDAYTDYKETYTMFGTGLSYDF